MKSNYEILHSNRVDGLTQKVKDYMEEGWTPVGSHQVVITHIQNRFRGTELVDSVYQHEYSQTMCKTSTN